MLTMTMEMSLAGLLMAGWGMGPGITLPLAWKLAEKLRKG